jgi:hypothetical protein
MKNLEYAKCPKCPNEAETESDIEELFGYRLYKGQTYVQSNCKRCRSRIQKRRRRLGIESSWPLKN